MTTSSFSCVCPFCSPRQISFEGFNLSKCLIVWTIVLMLLVGQGSAVSISPASPWDTNASPSRLHDNKPSSSLSAQKMLIDSSEATSCGNENCNCYAIGKCKPCSRFDIGRQLRECLRTGYKQRAYCPGTKQEHFISCRYTPHPFETRLFWLFIGSVLCIGAIAYTSVYLRQRRIKKMVAMRIQQQINA